MPNEVLTRAIDAVCAGTHLTSDHASAVLDEIKDDLDGHGITLAFAELKDPVKAKLRRYGVLTDVPEESMFPTVGTAVSAYVKATGQEWTDWEEGG